MKPKDWRPTAFVDTTPSVYDEDQVQAARTEQSREACAWLRLLVTLSAAALFSAIALPERFAATPLQRQVLPVAIGAFAAGVVVAAIGGVLLLVDAPRAGAARRASARRRIAIGAAALALLALIAGLVAVALPPVLTLLR